MAAAVDLPGGRGLSPATPQARHHFTTLHQVNQLVEASEADADLGFMARLLALCSLPRTNPGDRREYVRHNGPYTLTMTVNGNAKLPYGNIPRLLLAWVCTEAVRTQRRELVLGRSLYEFMRKLGRAEFWWDATRDSGPSLWDSTIELWREVFSRNHRAPCIDRHEHPTIAQAIAPRPRPCNLWLTYRTFNLKTPLCLSWRQIYRQFGADPSRVTAGRVFDASRFRAVCLRELKKIKRAWPGLYYHTVTGGPVIDLRRSSAFAQLVELPATDAEQALDTRVVEDPTHGAAAGRTKGFQSGGVPQRPADASVSSLGRLWAQDRG